MQVIPGEHTIIVEMEMHTGGDVPVPEELIRVGAILT
jgi:hypothetical protein